MTKIHNVVAIAIRLRVLREQFMSCSRPLFADLIGLPPTTIKNYELGYREVSATLLSAVTVRLGQGAGFYLLTGSTALLESSLVDGKLPMSAVKPLEGGAQMWEGDLITGNPPVEHWGEFVKTQIWAHGQAAIHKPENTLPRGRLSHKG